MMKYNDIKKNISIFILAVLIIAVYKTFDSIGTVFGYIGRFLGLFVPIIAAFAIAFILHPVCQKLEDIYRKIKLKFFSAHSRGWAITTVYLAALAIVAGFFSILLPMLFSSITELIQQLPGIIEKIGKFLYSFEIGGYTLKPFLDKITIKEVMSTFNLDNVQTFVNSLAGVSKGIINIFLVIIISIYILADRVGLMKTAEKIVDLLVPDKSRAILKKYANKTFFIMYRYIYCQIVDVIIVFAMAFVTLSILGVKYAPILAVTVGIFNIIPYFGATVACALAAILTVFTASFSKGVVVAIVLIVLQQIDANIIQPRLVRDTLKVKPFWVLCGISIGGGLFGFFGILLAVPVMALCKTLFEDLYDYQMSRKTTVSAAKESPNCKSNP